MLLNAKPHYHNGLKKVQKRAKKLRILTYLRQPFYNYEIRILVSDLSL